MNTIFRVVAAATLFVLAASITIAQPDHSAWTKLLQKHVSAAGKVNYKGIRADKVAFDAYLNTLSKTAPAASWSREQAMAYWINTYNAFTIKLIVDNYPVSSINKLHGGKPWDAKWIVIAGSTYSLNQIENDILRPKYKDARIHFAVNCAAKSCPPLYNKAFTAAGLNAELDMRTKAFINNTGSNVITANELKLSKIFEWYRADFGDLATFVNKYSTVKTKPAAKVSFLNYDWALNE